MRAASVAASGAAVHQPLLEHLAEKCHARQMLTEPVVQVLSDPPLLALADVENRGLERAPIRDVEASGNHVRNGAAGVAQNRVRP